MADTIPKVIEMARKAGLDAAADRLDYLYKLPVDNDDAPIDSETTKSLVSFMIEYPQLTTDVITVNSEGFVHATWEITQDNELNAQFLHSGKVLFIYTVTEPDADRFKILKTGDTYPDDMLNAIMPLIEQST